MLRGFQLKNIQEVILEMYIRSRMLFPKIAVFHLKNILTWFSWKSPVGPGKKKKMLNRDLTGNRQMFPFRLQPCDHFHPPPSPQHFVLGSATWKESSPVQQLPQLWGSPADFSLTKSKQVWNQHGILCALIAAQSVWISSNWLTRRSVQGKPQTSSSLFSCNHLFSLLSARKAAYKITVISHISGHNFWNLK